MAAIRTSEVQDGSHGDTFLVNVRSVHALRALARLAFGNSIERIGRQKKTNVRQSQQQAYRYFRPADAAW
jgi:hypothetical protein